MSYTADPKTFRSHTDEQIEAVLVEACPDRDWSGKHCLRACHLILEARARAEEAEALVDHLRTMIVPLLRLKERCDYFDIAEPLLSGERLVVQVEWIDRKLKR